MPISKYDPEFGGKSGSASEAYDNMQKEYGEDKGERVFYATMNRNKKRLSGRSMGKRTVSRARSR